MTVTSAKAALCSLHSPHGRLTLGTVAIVAGFNLDVIRGGPGKIASRQAVPDLGYPPPWRVHHQEIHPRR